MKGRLQRGFTLIELMLALALGLLLTAASLMLFLSSERTYTGQKANSEIENSSVVGLDYLEQKIRLISAQGGVQFASTVGAGNSSASAVSTSKVNVNSDQLTIQYTVNRNVIGSKAENFDCQGVAIPDNTVVTERYYVIATGLACRAVQTQASVLTASEQTLLSGAGLLLIPGVDYFHVLVVGQQNNKNFVYTTLNNIGVIEDRLVGLDLGFLLSSRQPIQGQVPINDSRTINVLDQNLTLNNAVQQSSQRFLRQVAVQTVAFRNGVRN